MPAISKLAFRRPARFVFGLLLTTSLALPAMAHVRVVHRRPRVRVAVAPVIVLGRPRPIRTTVVLGGRPAAVIDFNVKPRATRIYVDGIFRGTADDFDGWPQKMHLRPGTHRIRLETPDGRHVARTVALASATEIDLRLDLR